MGIFSSCSCLRRSHVAVEFDDDRDRDDHHESPKKGMLLQVMADGGGKLDGVGTSAVRRYRWEEIETMTGNFSQVIGVGGFSTVYLGHLPESDREMAAVKVYKSSERLNQVFKTELDISRQMNHPSIVKLLGYCDHTEEGVLVFEYICNGTLQEKLHGKNHKETALPWESRMAIAFQLAQALEYIHERCSVQIVHGDVKSSNLLLDSRLNCKLCDFGSAKMGFSSFLRPSLNLMGSPGYIDPHYLMTGIASKKNDIYSFGIIMLELITGLEAFSSEKQRMLASMVQRDNNLDIEMVVSMTDRRIITGDIDMEEAASMASLAAICLHSLPSLRPSATDVRRLMNEKISSLSLPLTSEKSRSLDFDVLY
ncbi:hypothetical protein Dimus_037418 [Dionaea muscipula]